MQKSLEPAGEKKVQSEAVIMSTAKKCISDIGVHLLQRQPQCDYMVVMRCTALDTAQVCTLVQLESDGALTGREKAAASVVQENLSHVLMYTVVKRVPPGIRFIDAQKKIYLLITLKDETGQAYNLMPISITNKRLAAVRFENVSHASAYAGELIDMLFNGTTDWSQVKIDNNIMTLN